MRVIEASKLVLKDLKNGTYLLTREAILNAPTFEAEPVREGKILETNEKGKNKRVFSCCNVDCTQMTMWMWPKYCPNCGAKIV